MKRRFLKFAFFVALAMTIPVPGYTAENTAEHEFFEKRIRPILVRHCYECHASSLKEPKGGLRLDWRDGIRKGGESGPAVVPGNVDKSLLIGAIRHETLEMPPETKLPDAVISDFVQWIEMGAHDPRDAPPTADDVAAATWESKYLERRKWWSLQPVTEPEIPSVRRDDWSDRPIDRFILSKLEEKGLHPSPRADRATLARRLSFNLTGLPPSPSDVESFLADESTHAWSNLVDRMLDSPHFGERWARHWMDVVRYTDTYGYEWDVLAKGAWRYRDYLIRAFNTDVPFDQLVREQIAGDLLDDPRVHPRERINESLIGPMFFQMGEKRHHDSTDFNGVHQEMLDNKIDAFSKAFQATTISCARCHDHMLDAVAQREYYALAGVFMSSRWVTNTVDWHDRNEEILAKLRALKPRLRSILGKLWLADAEGIAAQLLATASGETAGQQWQGVFNARLEKAPTIEDPLRPWIDVVKAQRDGKSVADTWRKSAQAYDAERKKRRHENAAHFKTIVDFRSGIPVGWSVDGTALDHIVRCGDFVVSLEDDHVIQHLVIGGIFTNSMSPRLNGALRSPLLKTLGRSHISYQYSGGGFAAARVVFENAFLTEGQAYLKSERPTWLLRSTEKGPPDSNVYHEFATKSSNPNFPPRVGLGEELTDEQITDPKSWFGVTKIVVHQAPLAPTDELARFEDLFHGDGRRETEGDAPASLEQVAGEYARWFTAAILRWNDDAATEEDVQLINWMLAGGLIANDRQHPEIAELVTRYRETEKRIKQPWTVNGMADLEAGQDYRFNIRGDFDQLGDPVPRGYLRAITDSPEGFKTDGSGRLELAELIADPKNPRTARVFVNRVWHWLFGTGIVATPSDFGHLGELPSHPELLDYLASRFVAEGWSIKKIIRSIVISETWQQSGLTTQAALDADARNRLLHHYPVRRLEAEAIRDAVLAVSGRLDPQLYGPPINPHRQNEDPQKRLYSGPIDGNGRRSIYTKITIMEPPRFLAIFNQPKPKISTDKRDSTSTTAQSLAMLNDPFVRGQSEHWGRKLVAIDHASTQERLTQMLRVAFGRAPETAEIDRWTKAVAGFANAQRVTPSDSLASEALWTTIAHVMFNIKEFMYVK